MKLLSLLLDGPFLPAAGGSTVLCEYPGLNDRLPLLLEETDTERTMDFNLIIHRKWLYDVF